MFNLIVVQISSLIFL